MTDIEIVTEIYAAMARRDFDALFAVVDPGCVITQDAALPWGGRYVGHDGFAKFGSAMERVVNTPSALRAPRNGM